MKYRANLWIFFLTGITLVAAMDAAASDLSITMYRQIANRNSFGLRAPPEQPKPPPVVSPRPRIRLAGITTILGKKMAFLIITGSEKAGPPECLVLGEGERQHEIEVTEVDESQGTVKVRCQGQEQTLQFSKNVVSVANTQPIP